MAIPVGTTARQVEAVARWLLAAVVVVGMLGLWSPGYGQWGVLAAGVLATWTLWLCMRIVSADRTVACHPAQFALVVPACILAWHAVREMALHLHAGHASPAGMGGLADSMNMSVLFHLWLVAVGIMVCQDLLAGAGRRPAVLAVCGLAMMVGPVIALEFGAVRGGGDALGLVAFAGVAVWLSPLWGLEGGGATVYRPLRLAIIGAAGVFAALLAGMVPLAAIVSSGVAGVVLVLCAVRFRGRGFRLLVPACLLVAGAGALACSWPAWPALPTVDPGLLGVGERAFEYIGGGEPGLFVLFGMVGWAGAVWLVAGLAGTIVLMLFVTGGGRPADAGRTAVWAVASALAVCGALAGGGLSMPVPTIAVAVTLGLLPAATGGRLPRAHGAAAVFAFGALLVMLALAPLTGLVAWAAKEFGLGDTALHVQAGFLATMAFAWLGGARRIRWGLAAILAVALAGGGAELLQGALSQRTESLGDWVAHLKGCAIGTALYLLCVGARLCESPEAGELAARTERAGL